MTPLRFTLKGLDKVILPFWFYYILCLYKVIQYCQIAHYVTVWNDYELKIKDAEILLLHQPIAWVYCQKLILNTPVLNFYYTECSFAIDKCYFAPPRAPFMLCTKCKIFGGNKWRNCNKTLQMNPTRSFRVSEMSWKFWSFTWIVGSHKEVQHFQT